MMYMIGQYDRFGKFCTKVTEVFETKIVDKSPLEILDDSIKCIAMIINTIYKKLQEQMH